MEYLFHHSFEILYLIFHQHFFTGILGALLIYRFRITGTALILHAFILWVYLTEYKYEIEQVSELVKSVNGAFYEENLFNAMFYGLVSIPLLIIFCINLDIYSQKKSRK